MLLDPEQVSALTSDWDGDRSPDGRPRVPDNVLTNLADATAEHAWSVLDGASYPQQYVGQWAQSSPGRAFVGRAVTCAFVPFRPDYDHAIVHNGDQRGFTAGQRQNTWVIESLTAGDCLVADIFGKVFQGTVVGDNLGTAVASRTGVGAVIDGGVRDLTGLRGVDANFYFRDTDPSPIRAVTLTSMNGVVTIGGTTVLPGDVVLGTELGVTFIPPHLAEAVVAESKRTAHRDRFGKMRIDARVYTTTEIDVPVWADHIEADYADWSRSNPI